MKMFLVSLLCCCAIFPLNAQQSVDSDSLPLDMSMSVSQYRRMKFDQIWETFPKFEMRIGYSGFPMADVFYYGMSEMDLVDRPGRRPDGLEGLYAPSEGATYITGNIGAEFSWHIKKWFSLAGGLYFDGIYGSMIDPSSGRVLSRTGGVTVSFVPTARFYWANFETCRLYSSAGVGISASSYEGKGYVFPAFQFSPIGVTVGRKVFFFAEYSGGTVYMGAQAGVGYRF